MRTTRSPGFASRSAPSDASLSSSTQWRRSSGKPTDNTPSAMRRITSPGRRPRPSGRSRSMISSNVPAAMRPISSGDSSLRVVRVVVVGTRVEGAVEGATEADPAAVDPGPPSPPAAVLGGGWGWSPSGGAASTSGCPAAPRRNERAPCSRTGTPVRPPRAVTGGRSRPAVPPARPARGALERGHLRALRRRPRARRVNAG